MGTEKAVAGDAQRVLGDVIDEMGIIRGAWEALFMGNFNCPSGSYSEKSELTLQYGLERIAKALLDQQDDLLRKAWNQIDSSGRIVHSAPCRIRDVRGFVAEGRMDVARKWIENEAERLMGVIARGDEYSEGATRLLVELIQAGELPAADKEPKEAA